MTGGKNSEEIKDNQKTQDAVEEAKTETAGNTEAPCWKRKAEPRAIG
jgi:hypothetical protein